MKIGEATISRSTGGSEKPYEDFDDKATELWGSIVKEHPDAKLINIEHLDVGKFYWELVKITYTYEHQ
jgi:hypothetical protein